MIAQAARRAPFREVIMKNLLANNALKNKKNTHQQSLVALALTSALALTASVQAETVEEVITVTATRTPTNIDTALATQVVITRADIERIQPKSVLDLIGTVAGVDVINQGGRGQNATVFLRGANANHTLVLLNGVRISSASLGSTSIQTIAPELIERIEIVKGPRAAIWGSDAIGGVIQIFTREVQSNEFFAGVTVGDDNYQQYKAGAGFKHGDGFTSISVNKEKSDGFDVLSTAEDDEDGYDYTSFAIRGQQQLTEQFALDWLLQADSGDSEYDNAFGGNNESEIDNHAWLARGVYQTQIGHVQNTTSFSVGQNRDKSDSVGTAFPTSFETRRDQYSLLNHAQVFPHLQFNLGVDYYQEELSGTTTYDVNERDVTGIFAHTLYHLNDVTLEAAVRYDDVEHIDSETSFNAGAGYQINSDTRIALNVGTGFKAPTFNDLYYPADPYSSGNPDLISETSETVELVLETRIASVDMSLNAYQSDIENLIVWTPDANFFYSPDNVSDVEISGVEFTANYIGLGGNHQLNASYVDSEDKATNKQLDRRARDHFAYQFDTKFGDLAVYFEYQYNGKRTDRDFTIGEVKLGGYSLVNVSASYPITSALTVEGRVSNLLDKTYQSVLNYNTQDRAVYMGINYAM